MNASGSTVHNQLLRNFCRLCGNNKAIPSKGNPVSKLSYERDAKRALGVDFSNDSDIHPPFICDCCRLKLSKWRKKANNNSKIPVNIDIYKFIEHSDQCSVCMSFTDSAELEYDFLGCCKDYGYGHNENESDYFIYKLAVSTEKFSQRIYVNKKTRTWQIFIHDIDSSRNEVFGNLPPKLTKESFKSLLEQLSRLKICPGNRGYDELCRARGGNNPAMFLSTDGQTVTAYEEISFEHVKTIRHSRCNLLLSYEGRCESCNHFRITLNVMAKRQEKKTDNASALSSKVRNDYLSTEQKTEKLLSLKGENKQLKRKLTDQEIRISELLEHGGQELSDNMDISFRQIISENERDFNSFPDGSPQKLLWTQQSTYLQKADKRRMRWHPTIIKWCIAIHTKSPKAYDLMRQSGFLNLPHECTLRDYTHFTKAVSGWNVAIVKRIKSDINFEKLEDFQKNVILLFDEVKVKDGLVYSTETGELIGFIDLGDVNNDIERLVNICKEEDIADQLQPLATHIIAFMVRGIFINLHQVFGHFPCTGFNSHQLFWSVWPGIGLLECAGFHVRALVCDGATPNRKFYRIHGVQQDGLVYFADNKYRPGYRIYFICDPPHLMKTTRNNWENSNWHNKTRNLEFDRQQITWPQLVNLAEGDLLGQNGQAGGLRMLPRLTNEHIRLTPSLRMKVKLATQVLSSSVARAFELVDRLRPTTQSTRKFIVYMDTFFDCLNVSRLNLDNRKRKPTLGPYRDIMDWRLEWLEEDFLMFLREWENQANARLDVPKEKRKRLCLSRETLEGLRITVKSFTKLVRELLSVPGVQYVLSGKFSQDPLEIYFSKQRGCGGNNDNPTVLDFNRNARNIFVAGTAAIRGASRGNCTIDPDDGMPVCGPPLQRRQRPR